MGRNYMVSTLSIKKNDFIDKVHSKKVFNFLEEKKISVLMSVCKEPPEIIKKSIDSILDQTYRNIQFVIIVDNPGNKEAINLINEYDDERICCYINEENMGLVKSLNNGLEYCQGEYVARMDADDISLPDRLEKQVIFLEEYNLDLVGANIEVMHYEDMTGKIIYCPKKNCVIKRAIFHDNCVKHPVWLVRKSVYKNLGGYRNVYTCEDYDLLLRAIQAGYKLGNCDTVGLRYRQSITSISRNNRSYQQTVYEYLRKHYIKGEIPEEDIINQYLKSEVAKKKIRSLDKYLVQRKQNKYKIFFYTFFYKGLYHKLSYRLLMVFDRILQKIS